jgi:hypothetical protein
MKITPDQALETVQSIFKSLDWEIEVRTDPAAAPYFASAARHPSPSCRNFPIGAEK